MMLGSDSGLTPTNAQKTRRAATRPEGVLFAMASPLETQSAFRWPTWLSPVGTSWEKPISANPSPSAHRRSL